MNKIWLVAKETYRREVKTWSYLLMILAPFLLVFFSFVIGMVSAGSSDDNYVGVVTSNSVLKQAIKKSEDFDNYSTEAKAKKAYKAAERYVKRQSSYYSSKVGMNYTSQSRNAVTFYHKVMKRVSAKFGWEYSKKNS